MTYNDVARLPARRGGYAGQQAGIFDSLKACWEVLAPTIAKGVIIRRPTAMFLADMLDLDGRAIRRMEAIRDRFAPGPVKLRIPGKSFALLIDPSDVRRVLAETPDPFSPGTSEKRAALKHFEPRGVLISSGAERTQRREWNEKVLESGRPIHSASARFLTVIDEEMERLHDRIGTRGEFGWRDFSGAWFRAVRRITLGDTAESDERLLKVMGKLRRRANWAFLAPLDDRLLAELRQRIRQYVSRGESGSLAYSAAHDSVSKQTAPEDQIAHWLFAFDAAAMATFRTLALLTAHRTFARRVREEIAAGSFDLPLLRAAILEAVRLWPTTPLILRETTADTQWRTGTIPAGTGIIIFTPFFHRDSRLPIADVFTPELWQKPAVAEDEFVPFSDGPAGCPGRNLVLLLGTGCLRAILNRSRVRLVNPHNFTSTRAMPATLNHFRLRFQIADL